MTRLLPRITRRRAERDAADATNPAEQPVTSEQPAPAEPAASSETPVIAEQPGAAGHPAPAEPATAGAQEATAVQPAAPDASVPAGADPGEASRPGFRERSRLRRRLQYLRRVRELGFRDLGGLVFDQHRFARHDESLVQAKVAALGAVDAELRAIERALDAGRPITELREVGVSACARCGALVGSDARFCSACGAQIGGARDIAPVVAGAAAPPAPEPAGEAAPEPEATASPLAARLSAWSAAHEPAAAEDAPVTAGAGPEPDPAQAPASEPQQLNAAAEPAAPADRPAEQ